MTRWSLIERLSGGSDGGEACAALEDLCRLYWFPLYAFARGSGHSPEQAEDLTQGYFTELLEKEIFSRARQDKGRLRSFLLITFKRFMRDQVKAARALKRGGGAPLISIDSDEAEIRYASSLSHGETPDQLFDRRWALSVLEQVLASLRSEYEAEGKGELFEGLKNHLAWKANDQSRPETASGLGMTENNLRVSVFRLRRRYGELLRRHIADTLDSPENVADEIDYLMSALS